MAGRPECVADPRGSSASGVRGGTLSLARYHDLASRLAVHHADGHVRGDTDDLRMHGGEPRYAAGERELARIFGDVQLIGLLPTSADSGAPSLVMQARAVLIVTTERVICLAIRGWSQLGAIAPAEAHIFVFPFDLIDLISMPRQRTLADRLAGMRRLELFSSLVVIKLDLLPFRTKLSGGSDTRASDDAVMRLIVDAVASHRLSLSPEEDHARLGSLQRGRYTVDAGLLCAQITRDLDGLEEEPAHLRGRLVATASSWRTHQAAAALLMSDD